MTTQKIIDNAVSCKSVFAATTSQQIVQPDVGYDGLEQVTVNPQEHTATYTPAADTAANDMGINNNYRYVDTSGMVTPTSITPSNTTPVALTSGTAVAPTANGYAIQSYDNITPPSSPQAISSGDILKMNGNGYVIDTYSAVTPSDSTPPQLSQGSLYVPNGNGYLYATQQSGGQAASGSFTLTASADVSVDCGFKPKYIAYYAGTTTMCIYNEDVSSANWIRGASSGITTRAVGASLNIGLKSVDDTGFSVIKTPSSTITVYYFACS